MLASANDVGYSLVTKRNANHGEGLEGCDAEMQLEFADCQDCLGGCKEADSKADPSAGNSADLPRVRHLRRPHSVSGK
jgi:hypothetical protein